MLITKYFHRIHKESMVVSFADLQNRPKRRVSEMEDDDNVIWSQPYESLVRQHYPFKSKTDIYGDIALDPRYHTIVRDPSENIPPSSLPSAEDLDFTLLSADIVCKYWSQKQNVFNSFKNVMNVTLGTTDIPATTVGFVIGTI